MHFEDEFIDSLHQLYLDAHRRLSNQRTPPANRIIKLRWEMVANRLSDINSEIERTLENLRKLPYTAFGVRCNSHNQSYLMGVTQPIYFAAQRMTKKFPVVANLGKYVFGVPSTAILNVSLSHFHFIPLSHLKTGERHFHHTAAPNLKNPLDAITETCWASVGPLMINALELVDLALIFEAGFLFLRNVNLDSQLGDPHYTEVTVLEYARATSVPVAEVYKTLYGEAYLENIF